MGMNTPVTLDKYMVIATGEIFFAYQGKDAKIKHIDGEEFIEVTSDWRRTHFIKKSSLTRVGSIVFRG
jgi:hypothetical protein